MRSRLHSTKLTPLLLAISVAFPLETWAQTLEEVVVSASRSEQRSFDAPAAVQSVSRDVIQSAGPQINLSESLSRVPGLTILDRQNYAQDLQLSIRGFGARSPFGIRGIRLLIDGIPASTPDGQGQGSSISLPSTERIEVLRGPMALLYGNSSGGVIQAFTKPAPATPELGYQYYIGSYGLHRADYQLGDTFGSVGIVADYSTMTVDGYRANSAAERKQFNGKITLVPSESLKVNVVFNRFDMPLAQDPLGLTRAQLQIDPASAGTNATATMTRKIVLQNQLGTSATYTVDADHSLTWRGYYGTRENTQYLASSNWVGLNRAYYGVGLQYNARSVVGNLPVQWVAGYEFDRSSEYRQGGAAVVGQKSGPLTRSEDNMSESSDVFAQGSALLSARWTLAAGLRSSKVRFISDDYLITPTNPDGSGNVSYQASSPVLGATYHASERLNLYANYGKGFETPTLAEMAYDANPANTTTLRAQFNPSLNASGSQHYELGSKWVPSPSARVDLAVYKIDTVDEIVVLRSSQGQSAFKNAPSTTRTGWELSGNTMLTSHLSLSASASMINAQYSQAFTSGATTVSAGKQLPGIPQSFLFSELAWSTEAMTGRTARGLRLGLEVVQTGRLYANDTNTESADGRTVFNLSASQRWNVGKNTLTAYARINNVSNERYVGSVIVNQAALQFYEPGLPQNGSLGLNLRVPL